MNNTVNFDVLTPNINFTAKKVNNENLYKTIDAFNDIAVEYLNKDKSLTEKKETAIRKSLEGIFKKFGKKLRNGGKDLAEIKKQNRLFNTINAVQRDMQLKMLMKKNPDEAREQIMRESLEDIGKFLGNV